MIGPRQLILLCRRSTRDALRTYFSIWNFAIEIIAGSLLLSQRVISHTVFGAQQGLADVVQTAMQGLITPFNQALQEILTITVIPFITTNDLMMQFAGYPSHILLGMVPTIVRHPSDHVPNFATDVSMIDILAVVIALATYLFVYRFYPNHEAWIGKVITILTSLWLHLRDP